MIKAICFDLDGVYFTPKGKNSFHQGLITEYGVKKEIVDEVMQKSSLMAKLVRGQINATDFWNEFRNITGITASDQELTGRWVRDYEINPQVKKAVLRAKELGYKTCVCTNNNGIRLPRLVEQFNLAKDFDVIVSSHEIGHPKPAKEIFGELLKQLNVKPNELIYSDDNPNRLAGASELGIETFVFENFDQFIGKIRELGINLG